MAKQLHGCCLRKYMLFNTARIPKTVYSCSLKIALHFSVRNDLPDPYGELHFHCQCYTKQNICIALLFLSHKSQIVLPLRQRNKTE